MDFGETVYIAVGSKIMENYKLEISIQLCYVKFYAHFILMLQPYLRLIINK